jgi:hypothetical protein
MRRRTRGQRLLRAQRRGAPVGSPPSHLSQDAVRAWHDIATSCPDVLRSMDDLWLELAARSLAAWRLGPNRDEVRPLYRMLGQGFMRMADRRRLLFPDRPKK